MAVPQSGHTTRTQGTPRWCGTAFPHLGHTQSPPGPAANPSCRPRPLPRSFPRPVPGPCPVGPVLSPRGMEDSPFSAVRMAEGSSGLPGGGKHPPPDNQRTTSLCFRLRASRCAPEVPEAFAPRIRRGSSVSRCPPLQWLPLSSPLQCLSHVPRASVANLPGASFSLSPRVSGFR